MLQLFVASSSEGLKPAAEVCRLLTHKLQDRAKILLWKMAFELSSTYVESLEKAVDQADFAVFVLTSDDLTTSREKQTLAPRDNVVFEMGLFMGRLGRERCFIVQQVEPELKVPSDLLGVETATFKPPVNKDWREALLPPCESIVKQVEEHGERYKVGSAAIALRKDICAFASKVNCFWWERINDESAGRVTAENPSYIGFFQIDPDLLFTSVTLHGTSYSRDGLSAATWKSVMARVDLDPTPGAPPKIMYHWKGSATKQAIANLVFSGFGQIEFVGTPGAPEAIASGRGKFWDLDEANPSSTTMLTTELRRATDPTVIQTMTSGKEKDISVCVQKTLADW